MCGQPATSLAPVPNLVHPAGVNVKHRAVHLRLSLHPRRMPNGRRSHGTSVELHDASAPFSWSFAAGGTCVISSAGAGGPGRTGCSRSSCTSCSVGCVVPVVFSAVGRGGAEEDDSGTSQRAKHQEPKKKGMGPALGLSLGPVGYFCWLGSGHYGPRSAWALLAVMLALRLSSPTIGRVGSCSWLCMYIIILGGTSFPSTSREKHTDHKNDIRIDRFQSDITRSRTHGMCARLYATCASRVCCAVRRRAVTVCVRVLFFAVLEICLWSWRGGHRRSFQPSGPNSLSQRSRTPCTLPPFHRLPPMSAREARGPEATRKSAVYLLHPASLRDLQLRKKERHEQTRRVRNLRS